ncbi:thiopeptide-type bacteriocin biosynthesis protein [Actinomadura fulvescens]|uniref:thiopeptide-type bacteriocin biosynthesis protein n=1 Tax=Actinomadura fulvescens TaxID=46160 RepID=UPI0031CEAB6D
MARANPQLTQDETLRAIVKVLAGHRLNEVAALHHMEMSELASAAQVYQQAGQRAIEQQAADRDWWQLYLQFTDWTNTEKIAADHLEPLLQHAGNEGSSTQWWFMRKYPCWRLRLRPGPDSSRVKSTISTALNELADAGQIERWWPGIYEPETAAFGGGTAMAAAHDLFHADSHAILSLRRHKHANLGRRELSVLLCAAMMHAAGLEWYEQGDVWHRVLQERPLPADIPPDRLRPMIGDLYALMTADSTPDGALFGSGGPAAFAAEWAAAFHHAGHLLGVAARAGALQRGLRHVLSYHVIFHWNRLGLPLRTQSILASAARSAVLEPNAPEAERRSPK